MKKTRTRGFRILRNLAAAVLCAVPLWGLLGCPMPTPELRFRQLEDRSAGPPQPDRVPLGESVPGEDDRLRRAPAHRHWAQRGTSTAWDISMSPCAPM